MESTNNSFDCWAVVEVFGKEQYAGYVSNVAIGGAQMLKIEVPEIPGEFPLPGFMKLMNYSSIFSITPVAEDYAVKLAERLRKHPIESYDHQAIVREMAQKAFEEMKYSEVKRLVEARERNNSSEE